MRLALILFSGVLCLGTARVSAQGPVGADTMSAAAVADSQRVLRELDRLVRANPDDSLAWFRRGMIAWALSDRARAANPPRGLNWASLKSLADTSLRRASYAAPKNALYRAMLGRMKLSSEVVVRRETAIGEFEKAYAAQADPKTAADSLQRSLAALYSGLEEWRRYNGKKDLRLRMDALDPALSGRVMNLTSGGPNGPGEAGAAIKAGGQGGDQSFQGVSASPASIADMREMVHRATSALPADVGSGYAEKSEAYFREAYAMAPSDPRTLRAFAMVLADRMRWRELEQLARRHLKSHPISSEAWLTLGLSLQRQFASNQARAAFDSALRILPADDRARLHEVQRIMSPQEAAHYTQLAPADRDARWNGLWLSADPLWSRDGDEAQTEFFARMWYAELRWSSDDANVHGIDTERGDVYVRYGPPDEVAMIPPDAVHSDLGGDRTYFDAVTYWFYQSGLAFSFFGQPGAVTTPVENQGRVVAERLKATTPVRWDNLNNVRVDSMLVQVARFRAARDSVDIVVAANPQYDSIMASGEVRQPLFGAYWLLGDGFAPIYGDTVRLYAARELSWTRRVAPGNYLYRVEASAEGGHRAAKSMAVVTANTDSTTSFALQGFGISDVLFASGAVAAPRGGKWSDTRAIPLAGAITRGSKLDIVWENYDFGQRDGIADYTITVSVLRDQSKDVHVAMELVGVPAALAKVTREADSYSVTFDRITPYAPAFADLIQLDLGDTAIGRYIITVRVTDKVSGKSTARTSTLIIH